MKSHIAIGLLVISACVHLAIGKTTNDTVHLSLLAFAALFLCYFEDRYVGARHEFIHLFLQGFCWLFFIVICLAMLSGAEIGKKNWEGFDDIATLMD